MHFELADVGVREALTSVESIVAPQAQARQITLEIAPCPASLVVRADPDKLRQVLLNLVTNAIKFTPEKGRIRVSCDAAGDVAHVRVADTGPGIPADRIEAIFEPFVQGDRALNRPSEGVGLGLTISRDLTRGMGGTLSVSSTPGEGAVFTVTLPRGGAAAPGEGAGGITATMARPDSAPAR